MTAAGEVATRRRSWRPAVAVPVAVAAAAGAAATLLLLLFTSSESESLTGSDAEDGALALAFLTYTIVGSIVLGRRPENRAGLVLLGSGVCLQGWVLTHRYAVYALEVRPLVGGETAAWLAGWLLIPGFGLAFTVLPLLLPDGRLASARHRPLAWLAAAAVALATFAWATLPGRLDMFESVTNPAGIDAVGRLGLDGAGWAALVLATVTSAGSLVRRYVRSEGVVRSRLRWFGMSAALMATALVLVTASSESGWPVVGVLAGVLFPCAVASLPIAALVAIFRHDMFDVDIVVSRTLAFGLLSIVITGAYVALVVGIGALVGYAGRQNLVVSVAATAVVALAFEPARNAAQRLADRVVYGTRATPYEVLARLSHRAGEAIDTRDSMRDVARIVTEGTGAEETEVWVALGGELQRIAPSAPAHGRMTAPVDGETPAVPGASVTVPVRHHGELVGAIALTMPPGRDLTMTEWRLLDDLAAHAGLMMSNTRLVEDLKASRQRIVTAQDEERRRIERDLHDGVQQRLLALSLDLTLMATRVNIDPPSTTAAAIDRAAEGALEAMSEVRDLARGIHPAIVTEGGLAAAVDSLAERAGIPVTTRIELTHPLPGATQVTVYYVVAEALTNAMKHSGAGGVSVDISAADGWVVADVVDDGAGGARLAAGSGLTGLIDRVTSLGGTMTIESPPGSGTRLHVEIPCGSS